MVPQPPAEANFAFAPANGSELNLLTGEAVYAPPLPATVKVSSRFGDFADPSQLLVEGFLRDAMTAFNNPTVEVTDELGRTVFRLEIQWAANFLHTIVVTSELNKVALVWMS